MNLYLKALRHFFGEGIPIQQREPEPFRKSDVWMAYAGAVFLIAVATYIPIVALRDRTYLDRRKDAVLERCVIETNNFRWCWMHLTK